MPSFLHEFLIELFRDRPSLAPELLRDALGVALPAYSEVRVAEPTLNELRPVEYAADLVLLLEDGQPVYALIVEVQLQPDPDKAYVWPAYAANLRARLRCPARILVVTPIEAVARWASQPVGSPADGVTVTPIVLGPTEVPWVRDQQAARQAPELAMLSALAHGNQPGGLDVIAAALSAHDVSKRADMFYDLIWKSLNDAARAALEAMMPIKNYEYAHPVLRENFAKGKAEGMAEGKAEGEAQALLVILEARGLSISDAQRNRIMACSDLEHLERWIKQALTVPSVDELLS